MLATLLVAWYQNSSTLHDFFFLSRCMHTAHLYSGIWLLPLSIPTFVLLYAYSPPACIQASAFSHLAWEILSRCVFTATSRLFWYLHSFTPHINFGSMRTAVLRFVSIPLPSCILPVCKGTHISLLVAVWIPPSTLRFCVLPTKHYLIWNLVCIPPASMYLRFVLHIRIYKSKTRSVHVHPPSHHVSPVS